MPLRVLLDEHIKPEIGHRLTEELRIEVSSVRDYGRSGLTAAALCDGPPFLRLGYSPEAIDQIIAERQSVEAAGPARERKA